jgi:hypothetical protein
MTVECGLVLDGYRSLPEVCAPLAAELARCFWAVNLQSGPFDSLWMFETEANEALVESLRCEVPALENSSTCVLRPGSIPRPADRLIVDEWSYYFAIDAPEQQALIRATALDRHIGDFSEPFLRTFDGLADLFICHANGWWEFYCVRADWSHRLLSAWPDCFERDLRQAGQPPSRGRTV